MLLNSETSGPEDMTGHSLSNKHNLQNNAIKDTSVELRALKLLGQEQLYIITRQLPELVNYKKPEKILPTETLSEKK